MPSSKKSGGKSGHLKWILIAVALVIVMTVGMLSAYVSSLVPALGMATNSCGSSQSTSLTEGSQAKGDFSGADQQKNAQAIINAVAARNLPERAAIVSLATAMQESSLVNVNYGDDLQGVRNPDGSLTTSRGLFQQQDPWGPLAVRMDPAGATGLFLDRLVKVPNWQTIPVTQAAQAVQRSGLPDAYAQWETKATSMVKAMAPTSGAYGTSTGLNVSTTGNTDPTAQDCANGGKVGSGVASGKGDDYPADLKNGPIDVPDPWGYYTRECVSFAAWRMNVQMGWKPGEPYKFSAATVGLMGNANTWGTRLAAQGYRVDKQPAVGAIAWWGGATTFGIVTGDVGHVAVVSAVNPDGSVDIEHYNAQPPYAYSTMKIPGASPTGYIHVADIGK